MARLVSKSEAYLVPGRLQVTEWWFDVPLDYDAAEADGRRIRLFGRTAIRYSKPVVADEVDPGSSSSSSSASAWPDQQPKPILLFLQGGPGFSNPTPQASPLSEHMLDRGYRLLLLDYRGVGLSSPVSAATLAREGGPAAQARYLTLFRADNVVRDSEAVRKLLTADYPASLRRWSVWGQSFGGMASLTYLSFYPDGLREVFNTGGLAGLRTSPEDTYRATYRHCMRRNGDYYAKFPQDVAVVKHVAAKIRELGGQDGIPLPAGGRLTVPRLMMIGIKLGTHGGVDDVHDIILKMKADLDQAGLFSRATLSAIEQDGNWDLAPIYSLLHEPCWCYGPGVAGRWAADRVGKSIPAYAWLRDDWAGPDGLAEDEPLYFSGEMVYPFFFDVFSELRLVKETAQIVAEFDAWPALYDEEQLRRNEVPVYAAVYNDMFVDPAASLETASKVGKVKVWQSSVHYHDSMRSKGADVFRELLRLRDDTID